VVILIVFPQVNALFLWRDLGVSKVKPFVVKVRLISKIIRKHISNVFFGNQTGFVGPATRHILQSVSATSCENHGTVVLHNSLDDSTVTFTTQPKSTQSISNKRIGSALNKNAVWLKGSQNSLVNVFEYKIVGIVSAAFLQRNIDFKVRTKAFSMVIGVSSTRIEILNLVVLMQGQSHDSIGILESHLNPVPVMDINVYVEDFVEVIK
jgi:hypothetical protein